MALPTMIILVVFLCLILHISPAGNVGPAPISSLSQEQMTETKAGWICGNCTSGIPLWWVIVDPDTDCQETDCAYYYTCSYACCAEGTGGGYIVDMATDCREYVADGECIQGHCSWTCNPVCIVRLWRCSGGCDTLVELGYKTVKNVGCSSEPGANPHEHCNHD